MKPRALKKRLEKLVKHVGQDEVICFVFPNGKGAWYVEWNDSKTTSRRDNFPTVEKALEFAQSLDKVSDIFYHHRETKDVITIVDEWGGNSGI
ncbi:hypothetical protein [Streptococcus marmotae]|uniref:hypothetical protein n=1 Tax=Streptococcus marmotae TaxID=1825069 RepID=UPI00082C925C|nr:hypothetical protein [Streptococcus marmotae]